MEGMRERERGKICACFTWLTGWRRKFRMHLLPSLSPSSRWAQWYLQGSLVSSSRTGHWRGRVLSFASLSLSLSVDSFRFHPLNPISAVGISLVPMYALHFIFSSLLHFAGQKALVQRDKKASSIGEREYTERKSAFIAWINNCIRKSEGVSLSLSLPLGNNLSSSLHPHPSLITRGDLCCKRCCGCLYIFFFKRRWASSASLIANEMMWLWMINAVFLSPLFLMPETTRGLVDACPILHTNHHHHHRHGHQHHQQQQQQPAHHQHHLSLLSAHGWAVYKCKGWERKRMKRCKREERDFLSPTIH